MTDELPPRPPRGTPEGHTPEKPRPGEVGKEGTPGAAAPAGSHTVGVRGTDEHAAAELAHADEEHGHDEARLGPVDWAMWGYALLGVAAGLIVVLALWAALG
ncbi:MAG: hypothetical protein M3N29_06940 [Chloroflexota bacterium]|nr:hypothetical protein [Chloroflexota bacterium]